LASWRLRLAAAGLSAASLSPQTVRGYTDDCALFVAFVADKGMPTAVATIKRDRIEAFIAAEPVRMSASSAATREGDLMRPADGKSRAMLSRYAASAADDHGSHSLLVLWHGRAGHAPLLGHCELFANFDFGIRSLTALEITRIVRGMSRTEFSALRHALTRSSSD